MPSLYFFNQLQSLVSSKLFLPLRPLATLATPDGMSGSLSYTKIVFEKYLAKKSNGTITAFTNFFNGKCYKLNAFQLSTEQLFAFLPTV